MAETTRSESSKANGNALPLRQAQVLAEIVRYHEFMGMAVPTPYIVKRLSLSRATVRAHVEALYRKGWLETNKSPSVPRPRR